MSDESVTVRAAALLQGGGHDRAGDAAVAQACRRRLAELQRLP